MTEERLISWLSSRPGTGPLGDDCAFLDLGAPWAVTVDTQTEGVHVPMGPGFDPEVLARRLLAVNLSDMAAVGAAPVHMFLTLEARPDFDHRRFFEGLLFDGAALGLTLSGGDLSGGDRYSASLTLLGRQSKGATRFMPRSGAQRGDRLWLGGPVGRSHLGFRLARRGARLDAAGEAHLPDDLPNDLRATATRALRCHVEPMEHVRRQLDLGAELARHERSSGLDVSDGLAKDLHRLCTESGVGAVIEADAVALQGEDRDLAEHLGADPLQSALGGGEDYVLLFALPADVEAPAGAAPVGRITTGVVEIDRGGRRKALPATGFDHLAR